MADFSKSLSFGLYVYEVDPVTWAEVRLVGKFTTASISRSTGRMLESGNIKTDVELGSEFSEGYYRIVMRVTQGSTIERYDLATLYCTTVSGSVDFGTDEVDVNGLSVLYPARDCVMDMGSYVARDADGAAYAGRLLSEVLHAPVTVHGSFRMAEDFVFGVGATRLDCAWDVLESAGWCIQIDGRGRVNLLPLPSEPSFTMVDGSDSMPGVPYELDWSNVPNRYMAFDGAKLAKCVNNDPDSVVSTARRGFVKDADVGIDTSPVLVTGETLESYCRRRLVELSSVTHTITRDREYRDGVYPFSMVRIKSQPDGETSDVRVSAQDITCADDIMVSETYVKEVRLWR